MDSRGVSPMIATIVLIAIVFAVAAILALSLASAPQPATPFSGQLSLENIESGRKMITIKHVYGERAPDVIENAAGTLKWKNLELRINGVIASIAGDNLVEFISEGTRIYPGSTISGSKSMVVGDLIRVKYDTGLKIGDTVSLKWVPKNQTLVSVEVTY